MLKTGWIPNTPMKILLEPYYFNLYGNTIKIPAWYAYDWLSIPRPLQWLVDMNETQNQEAGLSHDFLYSKLSGICSKHKSDYYLRDNVKTSEKKSTIIFLWVYYFWDSSYKTDTNYKKYEKQIKEMREELWFNISLTIK